jgi:hypothetical protein
MATESYNDFSERTALLSNEDVVKLDHESATVDTSKKLGVTTATFLMINKMIGTGSMYLFCLSLM